MRPSRWLADLLLGARMSLAGGRSGLVRTALTAVGVGLGVAMLLVAVSFANVMEARQDRGAARDDLSFGAQIPKADDTILVGFADTRYRDKAIRGRLLQPEGPRSPIPPGLAALPGPGQLVVSPALATLLGSPDGALLRSRLDYPVVGVIGDIGLSGPAELAFYLGSDTLSAGNMVDRSAVRRDHFGEPHIGDGLDPVLMLIVVVIFVVLLLPIGLFVASSVRFGGESRDRRLAGVRLLGADAAMARRIAAGEALISAALGVVVGISLFLLGRSLVEGVTLMELSVFPADVRPDPVLAALIAVAVPAAAVAVTVLSLRRVVIEPLGVIRRGSDAPRRLWWRLVLPIIGLALLAPLAGRLSKEGGEFNETQVTLGVCLLLVGVATLLPWLVQAVVRRIKGGPVAWQLAIRRLQLDGSTSARAVTGVAVAVAGAIGLQIVFAAVESNYLEQTGQDPTRAQIYTSIPIPDGWAQATSIDARLRATHGVTTALSSTSLSIALPIQPGSREEGGEAPMTTLTIAECPTLRELAVIESCAEGSTFVLDPDASSSPMPAPIAGTVVTVLDSGGDDLGGNNLGGDNPGGDNPSGDAGRATWTIPADALSVKPRTDPIGGAVIGVLATPSALPAALRDRPGNWLTSYLTIDAAVPDVVDRVRNTTWAVNPLANASMITAERRTNRYDQVRRGLYAGAALTLLLIGASLLVTVLEQLRDRRRLLATLMAFGTRRSTLAWSILWQTAVPIALGLLLATATGITLGAVLLRAVNEPFTVDWSIVATMSAIAATVVLLVTALSTPVLWRLMRPEGLRTE